MQPSDAAEVWIIATPETEAHWMELARPAGASVRLVPLAEALAASASDQRRVVVITPEILDSLRPANAKLARLSSVGTLVVVAPPRSVWQVAAMLLRGATLQLADPEGLTSVLAELCRQERGDLARSKGP
jgi:hypothetical protein